MKTLFLTFILFTAVNVFANSGQPVITNGPEAVQPCHADWAQPGTGGLDETSLAPKWWKIARADIAGAAAGVKVGGLFGGAGAAIGAVVGGCIGSIAEAGMAAPNNPTNTSTFSSAENRTNPYDNVGRLHYQAIDGILANPRGIIAPDGTVNTANYYAWIKGFVASNGLGTSEQVEQYYPYPTMLEGLADTRAMTDLTTFVNGLVGGGKMSQQEANVLIPYFTKMESFDSFGAFRSYSVGVESQVQNSSTLSLEEKAALLSIMATARYGTVYWGVFE